jgi:phage gp46-like protein
METVFTQVGDIKFFYLARTAETLGPADVKLEGVDLLRDPGFETAALISFFSNARADNDDTLPDPSDLRGGFWGSALVDFQIGSKIWLLRRAKIDETTLRLGEQYSKDCLNWMIRDGIAQTIEASVIRGNRRDELVFAVRIVRKNVDDIFFKFFINWEYQTFGGVQ